MQDLLDRQHQEIETLRERIRQLEQVLVPDTINVPVEWRLTSSEARLFAFLTTRDVASKSAIMQALYSDRPDEDPEPKIIDVFVCKLRAKVKPFGVNIETVWGRGYSLADRGTFHGKAAA